MNNAGEHADADVACLRACTTDLLMRQEAGCRRLPIKLHFGDGQLMAQLWDKVAIIVSDLGAKFTACKCKWEVRAFCIPVYLQEANVDRRLVPVYKALKLRAAII